MIRWPRAGEVESKALRRAARHLFGERGAKRIQLFRCYEKCRVEHHRSPRGLGIRHARDRRARRLSRMRRNDPENLVDDLLCDAAHLTALLSVELSLEKVALPWRGGARRRRELLEPRAQRSDGGEKFAVDT